VGLSDVILATDADLETIAADEYPLARFPGADIKGIYTTKLAVLHALLTDTAPETLYALYDDPIHVGSDDGPFIYRLPDALVAALRALSTDAQPDMAARWFADDTFRRGDWSVALVAEALAQLCALAARAASRQGLYLKINL
jgi:hypothetical protein